MRFVSPGDLPTWWTSLELSSYGVPVRSGGSFDVHVRPLVSALLPATGPVAGGTRVALVGAPFGEAATLRCRFEASGATAVARFVGGAQLECAAPPSAGAGARVLEVSMNGQQFSSSGVRFTYQPAAAVSSLSPTRGAAEGGTPVTVLGSGFSAGAEAAGALLCRWNASVTPAAYVSESALVCNSTARARRRVRGARAEHQRARVHVLARALVATPSQRLAARPRPSRVRASRAPFTCLRCSRTCVAARRLEMTRKRARKVFKRKEVRARAHRIRRRRTQIQFNYITSKGVHITALY